MFAQRRNLFRLSFLKMLHDISLFWKRSRVALQRGALSGETLGVYLAKNRFSQSFVRDFVAPLGAAIWSCPAIHLMDFPAETFFKFFENHGFLSYSGQPRWQTVVGGSSAYVDAILRKSRIEVLLNSRLRGVRRSPDGPVLIDHNGAQRQFDAVVIATHADQALQLLLDPSPSETRILGAWRYENNHAVLHSSLSYLPPERRAWASWNYKRERGEREDSSISITYHMNRLQGLNCANEYCVTLNPRRMIDQRGVISEVRFSHPVYNFDSIRSQRELASLQGQRRTWYCGSYFGYGFHEDAIRAGHSAAQAILDARWH
ncbi:MAG: amine oxidase [Proteobacteria bacterium]|nr:MAG: amine oxidase [Pseudomonadota bacterium]